MPAPRSQLPVRLNWKQLGASAAAVVALLGGVWTAAAKVYEVGGQVQSLHDEVRIYATRNCEATEKVVQAIRIELARTVSSRRERAAALELFPPVVCHAPRPQH